MDKKTEETMTANLFKNTGKAIEQWMTLQSNTAPKNTARQLHT